MRPSPILVVDDEPDNFDVIETLLADQGYQLHYAAQGQDVLASLEACQPDLLLLDVMMPGIDGIEVCQRIRALPKWEALPIIMVTALTGKKDLAQCLAAGADDFISKPVNRLELIARTRAMLRIRHQYQQLVTFNDRLESTVQRRTAKLHAMIFQDELTSLPSRTALLKSLTQRLQFEQESCGLLYLDCDQFKLVNGSFGYAVGDQLLIEIAQRLKQHLRPDDMLARTGEDEFCFLLGKVEDVRALEDFVERILKCFNQPFSVAHCDIFMTVSLGIALSHDVNHPPEVYLNRHQLPEKHLPDKLLQAADTAMYQAKLRGRGCYQIFDPQMHSDSFNRLTLESDLQRALDQQEFTLHYQPIIDLETQEIAGFEALVRWQHPTRGMVSPGEFIPCMETSGMIVPLGMMVLEQACHQLYNWQQKGGPHLTMSVNLSVRQFACPTLLADIDRVLAQTLIDPKDLKLEITESAIMNNAEAAIALIEALRSRHIQISIDDFGTGYSSLGYLHRFPVDNLKIDRSFVQMLDDADGGATSMDNRKYHVVDMIVALSQQLDLAVIAEGIETSQQLAWLKQLGCQFGQGYFFYKPLAATDIEEMHLIREKVR